MGAGLAHVRKQGRILFRWSDRKKDLGHTLGSSLCFTTSFSHGSSRGGAVDRARVVRGKERAQVKQRVCPAWVGGPGSKSHSQTNLKSGLSGLLRHCYGKPNRSGLARLRTAP